MFIRQDIDGNWYGCRITSSNHTGKRHKTGRRQKISSIIRNWFLIKGSGIMEIGRNITFTKQFIGKRIRLKVEVIK